MDSNSDNFKLFYLQAMLQRKNKIKQSLYTVEATTISALMLNFFCWYFPKVYIKRILLY